MRAMAIAAVVLALMAWTAGCGTPRQVEVGSIPRGGAWVTVQADWPAGTHDDLVHAQTVPGGTGSCAGTNFRYQWQSGWSPLSHSTRPVSGYGGITAYNPDTCQVIVAWGASS